MPKGSISTEVVIYYEDGRTVNLALVKSMMKKIVEWIAEQDKDAKVSITAGETK